MNSNNHILENEFTGVKELRGNLACLSRALRQFICVYYDDNIWSILQHKKWPITSKIQLPILSGLSYRSWYERLAKAVFPGAVMMYDED